MILQTTVDFQTERCVSFETLRCVNHRAQEMAEHCRERAIYLTRLPKVGR
jgi:hypothetical protein